MKKAAYRYCTDKAHHCGRGHKCAKCGGKTFFKVDHSDDEAKALVVGSFRKAAEASERAVQQVLSAKTPSQFDEAGSSLTEALLSWIGAATLSVFLAAPKGKTRKKSG